MSIHLLVAPPASGKTRACLAQIANAFQAQPFASVWLLVPDRLQADEARARLAQTGLVLPVHVATFSDLHQEMLELSGCSLPVASSAMLHRLLQETIRSLDEAGQLSYYHPICRLPGFQLEMRDRIAELKRALVQSERLSVLAQERASPGLLELGRIYAAYQARLQALDWADREGLSWLAYQALLEDPNLMAGMSLLVVDGFDNFNPAQLRTLKTLAGRAAHTWITLPGTPTMTRLAHQRFAGVLENLLTGQQVELKTLPEKPHLPPRLAYLEAVLFETQVEPVTAAPDLQRIEANSPAEEAREALRWLKARHLRQGVPLAKCGVAVPELDSYRAALLSAAGEFGLRLTFSQGERLASTPAAAAMLDLLGLALNEYPRSTEGYPLRPLLDTIRSPYFDLSALGLPRQAAKLLEIASRFGQVVQGLEQWAETLTMLASRAPSASNLPEIGEEDAALPRLPEGELAANLLDGLRTLAASLAPPAGELPLKDWALWLQDLLESLGFFTSLDQAGENGLRRNFEGLLIALARSEALTSPCPADYPNFLKEWEGLLAASLQEEDRAQAVDAIRVLRVMEGRGLRFDALAVLGLAEGSFPAVERPDPFLSEEVRAQLDMEPRLNQQQAGLFYQAVTRADGYLLLTRPYLAKDGESWEASPYWNAVSEVLRDKPLRVRPEDARPLVDAASPEELLFWSTRRQAQSGLDRLPAFAHPFTGRWQHIGETQSILAARLLKQAGGPYEGSLAALAEELGQRYGPRAGWSASRLESYATCPFSFLISSSLGLEVLEPPQIGFQANQLGSLLHRVLEQVFRQSPDPANTADVLARLPEVAGRVFASAPQEFKFRPSQLWDVQQEELLQVLQATVQGIADLDPQNDWRPLAFECVFGMDQQPPLCIPTGVGEIRLHGLVDRVDINANGELRVIDYKSGGSHLTPQDLVDGRRLQLPLYALAASQALGLGDPVEGFYWKLFQQQPSSLKLASFQSETGCGPQASFSLAAAHVEAFVSAIRQGAFTPQPPQGGCPDYCAAAAWCWRYQAVRF